MGDPNRPPVTGYPAAPNGYSAQPPPPPSGTAYPYVAAHPPNAYYSYPNNAYNYHYDADSVRRAAWLRRIFAFVIGLVVIFGTITFIVWLVLRPQLPEFRVDSVAVSNLSLGNNSLVSFTSEVRLTARNPNKKMDLFYDDIQSMLYYESSDLAQTSVPPFSQHTQSETSLAANFAAAGSFVEKSVADGITGDQKKNGNVNFNLRMISKVKFEAKAWRTRRRYLRVFCADLIVGFPGGRSSGTLTGGPKQCRVGI
ncbi:NDR1/HIN1-like protein 10 [Andrographis paniculata]|uniref:NDR1/HIN1-like protein 10 n=1 Tax=Andrographis paniculata TaxID=175694 RepID=UPI0021E7C2D8|nr:NDR1/HIN1-like protein 10 [Andrographis paniculata]XP_051120575.1 NDR1/HIN1-like protein 10 [Andrographis paniculata]